MLQDKTETHLNGISPGLYPGYVGDRGRRESIKTLIRHLDDSGKVCPKAWYWQRFFVLFKPRYEPCWLSSWWQTSTEDKKELFRKQLFFLAFRTDRYPAARQFLYELEGSCWLYE